MFQKDHNKVPTDNIPDTQFSLKLKSLTENDTFKVLLGSMLPCQLMGLV